MLEEKVNSLHILGVYILRTKKKSKEHFQRKNIDMIRSNQNK